MLLTLDAPNDAKVTTYMPSDMLADLDEMRAGLRRAGITVDRGRLIRSALVIAASYSDEWLAEIRS